MHYLTLVAVDIPEVKEEPEVDAVIKSAIEELKGKNFDGEKGAMSTIVRNLRLERLCAMSNAFSRAVDDAVSEAMEPYCENTEDPRFLEFVDMTESAEKEYQTGHVEMVRLPEVNYSNSTIRFDNVSFSYPGASSNALENISLVIPCHQKLGIVGLNGSGKTTLVKLILRLYLPSQGKITLNGIDISTIPFNSYIRHIGVVLQDYTLFAYSVKENIIFNGDATKNELETSIKNSGLISKIKNLPIGLDTSVGRELDDNGVEFSGGEGQKLAVARADYRNAAILILDEPTSALDPIAEYELFSRLNEIAQNKTTIFITHRLSSTQFCDHLIVLSNGKVIEQGSPSQLMKQNGEYARLFNSQAQYYSQNGVIL